MLTVPRVLPRALFLGLLLSATTAGAAGEDSPCYGAASRDPGKPCHDRALDKLVSPTPREAMRLPNAPCRVARVTRPFVCTFGAPTPESNRAIALVGDSHAVHWRAALGPVAEARGWHGFSVTRSACTLSTIKPTLPPKLLRECLRWRRSLPDWFARHRDIHTVVVSQHRAGTKVDFEGDVQGYLEAWEALPKSVKKIVVIRDTPVRPTEMRGCVKRAMARRANVGLACRMPRSVVLRSDPAATAARRARGSRVVLVDMSRFMCSRRWCYPVVGGALVHKDYGHITLPFGESMAPYLGRKLKAAGL